jgi:hypothetical protein
MQAQIPREKMRAAGEKMLELRRQSEFINRGGAVTLGDQWVTPKPDGESVEIAYAGYDNRGIFRFMGFATTHKIVSFYCDTSSKDNEQTKRIFRRNLSRLSLLHSIATRT